MPDMREKVREYIKEIENEIRRCEEIYEDTALSYSDPTRGLCIMARIDTLVQVKNDL